MKRTIYLLALSQLVSGNIHAQEHLSVEEIYSAFKAVPDESRTKVWWFQGDVPATREGLAADLEAFKRAGVGGVIYYDQVKGSGMGTAKVFSPQWWDDIRFAALKAKSLGLTFEINMSNGYVAGGPWITPSLSMKCVTWDTPSNRWLGEIATVAFPVSAGYSEEYREEGRFTISGDTIISLKAGNVTLRSMSYNASTFQKAHQSILQEPCRPGEEFVGNNFEKQPMLGQLEASDDGNTWRKVCDIRPMYRMGRLLKHQTVSFPAAKARMFRLNIHDWAGRISATSGDGNARRDLELSGIVLSSQAMTDNWEARAAFCTEYYDGCTTPEYAGPEVIAPKDILLMEDGKWKAKGGKTLARLPKLPRDRKWKIMRFGYRTTGGKIKHGRADMQGLECDKMSKEAAITQWNNYPQVILDSLTTTLVSGVIMDSHEAGPQNWTEGLPEMFRKQHKYDILRWLPAIAGYIIEDTRSTDRFLSDFRRTISDAINENYYATMDSLARSRNLVLTAQAMGNGQSCTSDMLAAKGKVQVPQGEFWARCQYGVYDIKEASSAAHLYGNRIASAEAYTSANYTHTLDWFRQQADMSMAMHVNEMVVCASAAQEDDMLNISGNRQYALNRRNTYWKESRPFWDYQARGQYILRQGRPIVDILVYAGDQTPMKLIANKLPAIPEGYDFDVCSTDALKRLTMDGGLLNVNDMRYRVLAIERTAQVPPAIEQKIREWEKAGLPVFDVRKLEGDERFNYDVMQAFMNRNNIQRDLTLPRATMKFNDRGTITEKLYFVHRQTCDADYYFVVNHSQDTFCDSISLRASRKYTERWSMLDGSRKAFGGLLCLEPHESCILVSTDTSSLQDVTPLHSLTPDTITIQGPWTVSFDPTVGGPRQPQCWDTLADWTSSSSDSIKYYSGTARYESYFVLDKIGRSVRATIRKPGQMAHVYVNGADAGCIWTSPWSLDITPYVRDGVNTLSIDVTNSLKNRLVLDSRLPEAERIYPANAEPFKPTDSLVPSGMMDITITQE